MKTPTIQPLSLPVRLTRSLRTPFWKKTVSSILLAQFALWSVQVKGATYDWDPNVTSGVTLGGAGTWNTSNSNWWDGASNIAWPNTVDTARFGGNAGGLVTLGSAVNAGGLIFNTRGYSITGGGNALTLNGGAMTGIGVNGLGNRATIDAQLSGTSGLTKTGNGVLVLSNNSNNFTGNVLVNQGALVVTNPAQLGSGSLVSVNGANQINNTGGVLVVQGGFSGMTLSNNLSLVGRGLNYANTTYAALANIGQNTISGNIAFGNASSTGIGNAYGNLTLSGTIGLASAQNTLFGIGNGNTIITGQVTGSVVSTDRLIKTQSNVATSLWLTNTSNNYVSDTRIDSGNVRVTSNAVLGASTSATAIDMNNGTLEVLTDAPDFSGRNLRVRDNTTGSVIFVSRGLGGTGLNQTVSFGTLTGINLNTALTIQGRDGYNVTVGAGANIGAGGNNNVTFNNSSNGTFTLNTPSLWNSTNTDGSRTLSINGNGETLLTGIINAAPGSANHNLNKNNQGTFTIQGTTSNFRGNVNLAGGTLSIGTFGAINSGASGALQMNAGALSFTGAPTTGAGETVTKAINLSGTTGLGAILANQSGAAPTALVISNSISATGAGAKTLFLGGSASSSIVNQLNGVIQNNSGTNTTALTKIGNSTWLYSPSVASYGTAPAGVTVTAGGAAQTNSFTVSSSTGLSVGQVVAGTNVPTGAIITNINGNVITINANIGTAVAATTPLTFTQNSNFTGAVTVGGGTLRVIPTATTGVGSNLFAATQGLTFNIDNLTNNGSAGGTFQLGTPSPALSANLTQTMGALTPTAGAGRVQVDTGGATFVNTLSFASMGTRAAGAAVNFAPAGANAGIQFAAAPAGLNGVLGGYATITNPTTGAVDFVATPGAGSNISALGAATLLPTLTGSATANYILNAPVTTTGAVAANTLRITGGNSLTLAGALTITTTSATAIGGILHDNAGGAASITGSTIQTSVTNQELIVNTSGTTPANALTIGSVITGNNAATTGTGGLTKNGNGTLILSGANIYTGTTTINEGTVKLSGSGTLGGTNAGLLIRQGGTFDLNGVNVGTSIIAGGLNNFSGAGTITNNAASGTAFIRVGNGNGGGTFSGLIQDGATAKTQFVKAGTGTVSLTGTNTFTGGLVITAGVLAVNSLPNFGTNSPIGPGITGNNAGSIVFNGGGTLQYTGSSANMYQTTQTPSVNTDRLFTIDGTGAVTATIDSSGQFGNNTAATVANTQNNAALIFGNTGAVAFSGTGTRTIQLQGNSTGDNEFKPLISDKTAVTELTGVTKAGGGLWHLTGANTYSGPTTITAGALQAIDGVGLPATSNLTLNGGVFQTTGTFNRAVGTAAGQVSWTAGGGFSAGASKLTVNLGGAGATFAFGTASPVNTSTLILSSTTAQADVDFTNPINLGAGARTIQVDDNGQSTFDFATASGVISGAAGGTLTKTGGGTLILSGANTYVGATTLAGGNVIVQTIGASGATATNLGTNVSGGALNIGSTTNAGILTYVGPGETTTRAINLAGTTGGATIDSSGSGPLVLTSVTNSGAGAKTLTIRGFNTDANSISSNLTDNGVNILSVTKSDAGIWELSGNNTFTGNLTIGGLLGANAAAALGAPGTGNIIFSNGGLYTNTPGGFTIARATQIAANAHATFTGSNQFTLTNTMTGVNGNPWTINNTVSGAVGLTISGNFNSLEAATQARVLAIQGTGNTVLSGAIQGTGASNGGVNFTVNTAPTATTTLTGASPNLMSVGGELRSGILILDKAQALGLTTTTFDLNGGELRTTATVAAQTQNINFRLNGSNGIINGANPLTMSGTLGAIGGNRTLQNDIAGPASLTISGPINLSVDGTITARTLTLSGTGTTNISGIIRNDAAAGAVASNVTYSGSGALNLNGAAANSWTGAATFNGGTTTVSSGATLGSTGTLTVNQAILTLNNVGTSVASRLGNRATTLNGATLNFLGNAAGTTEASSGALTIGTGGTTINNVNIGGNSILTFGSLVATAAGSSINFTGGVGTANNQVTFTTVPTLTPVTTGILARATVAGADFATYGATGIAAFTGYATPANVNSAAATDTLKVNGSTTTSSFTTNKTINALAFDTSAPTVSNTTNNVLTITSGGILATNGAQTLSARTNLGAEGAIHVGAGASLTISGVVTGAAGLTKNLNGALNITVPQFVSGTHTLNGGTTTLSGGLNTLFPNQTLVVNPTATLDLNGNSQFVGAFGGGNNPGTGGTITSSSAAVFSNNGSVAYGGAISGAITMNKTGGNTLTAESPLSYTGDTWITGGALTLRDNATLLNTSAITINYGTLNLDSNANLAIGNNNRVSDTAPITLRGGTITYQARFAAQGTESFGALTLAEGASTLNINAANNAGNNAPFLSTDVTFASLTRNAGTTVNITANQGFGNNGNANRVFFTTAPTPLANGMIGGWAIANTNDFAGYDPVLGVGAIGYGGFKGYDLTFAPGNITQFINNATPTTTNLTAAITTTSALRLGGVSLNDITFSSGSNTLVLESGGLLRSNQAAGSSIGTTATRGVLTAGTGSAAELVIYSAAAGTAAANTTATTATGSPIITNLTSITGLAPGQTLTNGNFPAGTYIVSIDSPTQITVSQNATANGTANQTLTTGRDNVVVNSVIADNGSGVVTLVKSGAGVLNLSANNTYTGGSIFNQGTVNLIGTGTVIPAGGVTLNGATLALNTNAGQIAASNVVTMNDSSTLTLVGANTLNSINFINSGGTGAPTVTTGGILTLTNSTPLSVVSNNLSTVPIVNGSLDFGSGAKTISVGAIQIGGTTLTNIAPSLNIAAPILSPGASITKTGNGILQLSGASTFGGGLSVSAGGIVIGGSSTPATGVITSGPLGTGAVTMAAGTTFLSNSTAAVGNPISFAGTPTFDSTATTAWTLTFNGALSGAGVPGGTLSAAVNNPGLTVALLGNLPAFSTINKTGPGTLIFSANNYTGDFNATALGNPNAVSLLTDGNGTGQTQTLLTASNVIFDAGIVPNITVGRAGGFGGSSPYILSANKVMAPASISNLGLGLTVTNGSGDGLLASGSFTTTGTPTYSVSAASVSNVIQGLELSGAITAATGFNKAGAGTLVLSNAGNTIGAPINVTQGVLSVSSLAQLGGAQVNLNPSTGTSTLRVTGNITGSPAIQFTTASNTRAIEVTSGNTFQLNSAFDVSLAAGAGLTKADNGILALNAANPTWTGALTISQGAVNILNAGALGTTAGNTIVGASGAALLLPAGTSITEPLSLTGSGIQSAGALQGTGAGTSIETGAITLAGATFIGADSGNTLSLTGGISGAQALTFAGAGNINLTTTALGAVSSVTKIGSGTTTLGVNSTAFVGGLTINRGTFVVGSAGAGTLGATGTITVNPTGTFTVDNTTGAVARLGNRPVTLAGGTFNYNTNSASPFTETSTSALTFNQGASTVNLNNAGGSLTTLTFGSLGAFGGGSSANITGLNVATSQLKFTTAPALTPATTGLLPRLIVNGNEFATYNATNGVVPFTGYAAATNILSVAPTQTFKATPSTLNSLGGSQTINALTLDNINSTVAVGGIGGNPPVTLTITSGAILAKSSGTGTQSYLNVPIIAFGAEGLIHVQSGQTLDVTSAMTGTAGLTKALNGTLNLNAQQFVSGTTTINGGTVNLSSAVTNTLLFNNGVAVNAGGTLNLNGSSQFIAGLSTQAGGAGTDLGGGTVTNTGSLSTLTVNGNTNFGGVITGAIHLNKTGTGALNFQAAQTYTGSTLITGGTVSLNDSASLPNTSQPIEIRHGSLAIGDGNLISLTNRVSDTAPITLVGGTIAFTGRPQTASTETLGALTLAGGHSTFTTNTGGTGINSLDVTIASLVRSDVTSTMRFNAGGQIGSAARLMITSAPTLTNNIIGAWAVSDREFASYDATYGVGRLNDIGFANHSTLGITNSPTATDNVRFNAAGTTILAANTTVNTLTFGQQAAATVLNLGGNTLTVAGGGLLFGQTTDNVDFSITNGSITSGVLNSPSDFFIHHGNFGGTNRTATIAAPIVNNGTGAVRVIYASGSIEAAGVGNTNLTAISTYTGGTIINSGNVVIGVGGALGTGGITVNNGFLTQSVAATGIPSQALTLNGGGVVNLAGNNSLTDLTFNNNGGAQPTLNPTGVLTLTGATGITASVSSPGTISTIAGGTVDLNANATYPISVGAAIINGVDVAPWQAGLNITSTIQNGGIVKSGAGLLGLSSGLNTFTGGVNITAGGLVLGASSTPNTFSGTSGVPTTVTSGPVGTGLLTLANNTTVVATTPVILSNDVTFADNGFGVGNNVFNGTNNITFNGITTLPATWNVSVTAPQTTVTIADVFNSIATDVTNKSGPGTLVLNNYAGSLIVAGGLTITADGNGLGTQELINLGGNVTLTGDTSVLVKNGSSPNARNKTIQQGNLVNNGSILNITPQNGFGLEFTGTTSFTGASTISVGAATASNVVQGLTLSGVVSDAGGYTLVKSGPGTLALTNSGNTFGGVGATIDVLNGVLSASSDGALGNSANTISLQVDGASGLGFRATGPSWSTSRTFNLTQAINSALEVTAGTEFTLNSPFVITTPALTINKNDNGVLVLAADNSATGWNNTTNGLNILAGAVRLGINGAAGAATNKIVISNTIGAALQLSGGITVANPLILNNVANEPTRGGLNSAGHLQSVSGTNTYSGNIATVSDAVIGADSGSVLNLTGGIDNTGGRQITFTGAGTVNLSSAISLAPFQVNKYGSGTLNFTTAQAVAMGASTGAGITMNAGTTSFNLDGKLNVAAVGGLNINPGATLEINDNSAVPTTNRLGTSAITFRGGNFNVIGSTTGNTSETLGAPTFARGYSVITVTAGAGQQANLVFNAAANNPSAAQNANPAGTGASVLFRGSSLGSGAGAGISTIANSTGGFTFTGQTGAAAAKNKGILPWALVDNTTTGSGTSFATASTVTGIIRPLAANEYETANTLVASNNILLNGGLTTTMNVAAGLSVNSLTIDASANLAISTGQALTLASGGILVRSGSTSTISGGVINQINTASPFNVWTVGDLTISSTLNGGNGQTNASIGFVKAGAGTLTLAPATSAVIGLSGVGINSMSGQFVINGGTVKLGTGIKNAIQANNFLALNAGTLDLNGNSQQILGLFTDSIVANAGGIITSSTGTGNLVINENASRNFAGSIQGNVKFTRSGNSTTTLYSDQTYVGSTLINGGALTLRDSAALSGTSSVDINYATLTLDNGTSLIDMNNRLNDSAAITLRGATLNVVGRAQTASSEVLGAVTVDGGFSVINPNVGGTGINSIDVSLASLSRPAGSAATLLFSGTNLGTIGSSSRVTVGTLNGVTTTNPAYSANGSGLTNNIVGGWAVANNELLTYIPGMGLAPLNQVGAPQYDLTNTFVLGTGTKNVRLTATTNINAGGINVNAVSMTGSAINLTFTNAADTLNITSGALIGPNNNQTIGATVDSGRLTAGGITPASNSDLYIFNRANTLTINSRIIDNVNGSTSKVRAVLTASGGAITYINPNASYTGGTVLNGGTLNLNHATGSVLVPASTVPADALIINAGTVTMNNAGGQIAAANIVTMNGGGSTLNLFGNNTLEGLVMNNIGGSSNNVQVNTFSQVATAGAGANGVLTIGNAGVTVTSSNVASSAIIVGRADFGSTAKTINVDTINANGVNDIAPLQAAFILQGIIGTAGGISKTGNGVLQFGAQAHYTGSTVVSAGGIRNGVTNAGSRFSALTLNSGTRYDLNNASTTWGSLAGSGEIFSYTGAPTLNVGFDNTSTTFSGQFSRFAAVSPNAVNLVKIGTGVLTLDAAQNTTTGSTGSYTVNGGGITFSGAGRPFISLPTATAPTSAITFNVNNGGTLALDNSGTSINNRLGLNAAGVMNIQGGKLAINGNSSGNTSETLIALNVQTGGGRIELTPDAATSLGLTVTTLSGANGSGSLVVGGIDGSSVGTVNKATLTITNPALIGGQGGGNNGSTTMSVRHDILGDASVSGLGTGFLVKDTAVGGTYRALASSELASAFALPLTTDVDLVTAGNQAAGTLNVGLSGAATIGVNTVANTLTFSGTSSVSSSLGSAFGIYGPGGNLLTASLSNASASLTLAGATATVNTAFGSTAVGTTPFVHVIAGGTLNVNGAFAVNGTAGLAKADGGTLNFNNKAYYTGTTSVNNGTLNLNSGAANTIAVVPTAGTATVSRLDLNGSGAIVDLKGQNQAVGQLVSVNPLPGMGGTVTNTGAAAIFTNSSQAGSSTFGGQITGAIAFNRIGANTTTLTNANTYTGATTVRGGQLQLRDSGTISSTAGLTLNYGSLLWDNFGLNASGTPNPVRVQANNPVTMQGGSITINGAGSTDNTATFNTVTVTGGQNSINVTPYVNEGSTVKLTIGNLQRNTSNRSGVNFNGFTQNNAGNGVSTLGGQGLTQNGNVIINQLNGAAFSASNLVNNLIGGWAVADGNTFATYVNGFGVSVMGQTTQGIVAPNFTGTTVGGVTVGTGNYSESGAAITLASGAVAANSWRFVPGAAQTITFPTSTTATLGVGIITNANFLTTLAAADATNTLSGTGSDLYFYVNQNALAIEPAITGSAALVSNGGATLRLAPKFANNTYSGGTFVQAGTLNLSATSPFIAVPGALTITNAAVTMSTTANQIATSSAVTINGAGTLTLANYGTATSQTLDSITFNNEGGNGNPGLVYGTPTALSTVILSSANPLTATNNSLATTPTISTSAATFSALSFSNAAPVITVNAGLAQTGLNIAVPITSSGGVISKAGTGALALSGASTFTNGFNLDAGSLIFGVSTTGTLPAVTNGPVGTGTLTIAGGTTVLSSNNFTVGNATTVNGDFTFGGVTSVNNLTLSGAMNLGATGRTLTVTSPAVTSTISGAITSTATGIALTKDGAGTLILSSASNNFAGAAVAVTGGILKNGVNNAVPAASPVTVSAGAGYDLNGFDQTTDTLTGLGFVTNSANSAKTLTLGGVATNVTSTLDTTLTDNILAQATSRLNLTKVGTGTLTIPTANNHSGVTTVSGGMISITNAAALGTVTGGTVVASGASLELSNNITVTGEALSIAGTGSATNGALRNLSGNNTFAGAVTLTDAASIQSDAGSLTLDVPSGNAITATNRNLTFTGAGNTTVADAIAIGSGSLTKTGSGSLTLGATNTYSGKTTIANGTISVGSTAALGTNAALDLGVATTSSGRLLYTGGVTTLTKDINALGNGSDTIQNAGSGLLTLSGTLTKAGTTLNLVGGASGILVTGTIVGLPASSDLVIGNGTTTLQSANTYNGPTILNSDGTLNINHASAISTGAFTINGGTIDNTSGAAITLSTNNPLNINANFTFTGTNSLDLGTGAVTLDANRTVTVTANTLTIGGAISGAFSLTGTGAGTLLLTGASTYTGTTTAVTGSTISVGGNGSLGDTSSGTVIDSGASLALNNVLYTDAEALTINGAGVGNGGAFRTTGTSSFAGPITAASNATINAAGTLSLTGGLVKNGTTLTLGGTGTYNISSTGISGASANSDLVVDAATVNLGVASTYNGPTFIRNGGTINANVTDALPTSISRTAIIMDDSGTGSSTLGLAANQSVASLTGASSSQILLGANQLTVGASGSGSSTYAGSITGTGGSIVKDGTNTQIFSGANTYTGTTTLNAGTLNVGSAETAGISGPLGNGGSIVFGGGTLQYSAANQNDYSGRFSTAAGQAISIDTNSQNVTLATALISSGGSLNKQGAGALTVTAANTFDAGTTVNGGTLLVNNTTGSGTGSGAVSVSNAGTVLGGNGTIAGDLTVNAGALIAPGSSAGTAGTLTIGGSTVVINGNGVAETRVNFDYTTATGNVPGLTSATWSSYNGALLTGNGGQSNDLLNFTASTTSLTWNTGGKISFNQIGSAYSWIQGDVFNLLDWSNLSGGAIGGTFDSAVDFNLPTLGSGLSWDTSRFVTTGAIAVVPEPGRALLMLLGLMALFFRRRRQD